MKGYWPMKLIKKQLIGALTILLLVGCSSERNDSLHKTAAGEVIGHKLVMKEIIIPQYSIAREEAEAVIIDTDWSGYFEGINGAAVIYIPAENCYQIYNQELANTQRSPCSTFKIIASLTGLENQVIVPDDSVRQWSGEVFWNDDWNKDITFDEAFRSSCVWYFREVIDEIGKHPIQAELEKLQYGNCDTSDWEGKLNTNNHNRALTGFWIESSLKISPKEQTEVMERIFGSSSRYSQQTQNQLKQVMLNAEQQEAGLLIYGKTGMGKANGIVVDAWFTGFSEAGDKRIYFCVYLGESQGKNVSSTKAKEIAYQLISNYSANNKLFR